MMTMLSNYNQNNQTFLSAAGGVAAGLVGVYSLGNVCDFGIKKIVYPSMKKSEANPKHVEALRKALCYYNMGTKLHNANRMPEIKIKKIRNWYRRIVEGKNAVFNPAKNMIISNLDLFSIAIFHEMGHAINHNKTKFWSFLQKARRFCKKGPLVLLLTALLTPKKAEGDKPQGCFDKITTFVKENVGKLSILTLLPILAEELRASYLGNKLAKTYLSPELAKEVVKYNNKISSASYVVGVLSTGMIVHLANKIRDMVAHRDWSERKE